MKPGVMGGMGGQVDSEITSAHIDELIKREF